MLKEHNPVLLRFHFRQKFKKHFLSKIHVPGEYSWQVAKILLEVNAECNGLVFPWVSGCSWGQVSDTEPKTIERFRGRI